MMKTTYERPLLISVGVCYLYGAIYEKRETVELGPAGSLTCDEALEEENLVCP